MKSTAQDPPTSLQREQFYDELRARMARRYKTMDPLSMASLFNLIHTFTMGEARLAKRIASYGLTLPGLNTLVLLRDYQPAGLPLNELSRLQLVSRANITGLMDSLIKKGFVKRTAHPKDRRVIMATITKAGDRWLDHYLPGHYTEIRAMFSGLTVAEKKQFIALHTKLRRSSCRHPNE
jgi:DNA-binding MarR family transcriptional regulator